jgi:hypothetical protein
MLELELVTPHIYKLDYMGKKRKKDYTGSAWITWGITPPPLVWTVICDKGNLKPKKDNASVGI